MRARFGILAALLVASFAPTARAAFVLPGWARGSSGTTYQEWDVFTAPNPTVGTGFNTPDVAGAFNPNGTATLQNTDTTAFLVGTNIYSFSQPLLINVSVPDYNLGAEYITTVILQISSRGTEVDPATVTLTAAGGSPVTFASSEELSRTALGGFGGFEVDTLFRWEVAGSTANLTLHFESLESSMSLGRVSVDSRTIAAPTATAVPEPASMLSIAIGVGLFGLARVRRGRRSV